MTEITGVTAIAGVVGRPISHSLSPVLHNAWLRAAAIDAVYVPFSTEADRFPTFVESLRGGSVRGLNVTLPFKGAALAAADMVTDRARLAQAVNVLVFQPDGTVRGDNTDGEGLLSAFQIQAPGFDPKAGPVAILGAGGGARGAAAAFIEAGAPEVRIVNRTQSRAEAVARNLGKRMRIYRLEDAASAFADVNAVINATSAGVADGAYIDAPIDATPERAVAMDMVYRPIMTPFLIRARSLGRRTVDGLQMLIGQAAPSFQAFFHRPPPPGVDIRAVALAALEPRG